MTHEATAGHATASEGQSGFTLAECQAFRDADRDAAGHIVCLMVGIFLLGLVGYLAIAIWSA